MGPNHQLLPKESRIIVRIDRRFRGPPESGNGGYVAGLLAKALGSSDCEVMLKIPPPLDRDLTIACDGTTATLSDGESLVATAARSSVNVDVPAPPSLDGATVAENRFTGRHDHIFPGCFVCGPDREEADGLRIFPGATDDASHQVAAVWTPDDSLLDWEGVLQPEFVWAALDCPGYFAVEGKARPAVLGRLGVHLFEKRIPSGPLIVTGWPIGSDGRKHEAGTALHDSSGTLLAAARATWVTLRQ